MGEKNDLLSAVVSDDAVDRVEHLVEYLSCRVFGQAMYRHVILITIGRAFIELVKVKIRDLKHLNLTKATPISS